MKMGQDDLTVGALVWTLKPMEQSLAMILGQPCTLTANSALSLSFSVTKMGLILLIYSHQICKGKSLVAEETVCHLGLEVTQEQV